MFRTCIMSQNSLKDFPLSITDLMLMIMPCFTLKWNYDDQLAFISIGGYFYFKFSTNCRR